MCESNQSSPGSFKLVAPWLVRSKNTTVLNRVTAVCIDDNPEFGTNSCQLP
jgi:hypothetical protein